MQTAAQKPVMVPSGRRIPWTWWLAAVLSVGIAAYSLRYAIVGEAAYVPELAPSFRVRPWTVFTHTLFGPIALVLGLVNLLPVMRHRARWAAHRWVGRIYLAACVALAMAGLSMAFHAAGGLVARVGFGMLAVLTLATALQAYRSIKAGEVRQHREWMLRSYSLIFGAVTLRIWLPLLIIAHQGQFMPAYRWVAWVSWVPNIVLVEYLIRRGWRPPAALPERFANPVSS